MLNVSRRDAVLNRWKLTAEVDGTIVPISEIRKLRPQRQSQNLHPGCLILEPTPLITKLTASQRLPEIKTQKI